MGKEHKKQSIKKYKDLYGESPPFDLEGYKKLGHPAIIAEFIIYALFALFIVWGAVNLYNIYTFIKSNYGVQISQTISIYSEYIQAVKNYSWRVVLTLLILYIISLAIGYGIVAVFSKIAWILMYGSLILQLAFFGYLYIKVDWEYNWIFLIPVVINLLFFTIWIRKFNTSIKILKETCEVVSKEREMFYPYITQTLLITMLTILYFGIVVGYSFELSPDIGTRTYSIGAKTVTITDKTVFVFFTFLFALLVYIVYNITKSMKILIIHAWYRGGKWSFWTAYNVARKRFAGILVFSILAAIAHTYKFIKELLKGEWGVKTPDEIKELMERVKPIDMETLNKKDLKKIPLRERLFYYINYFTLYAITIENKPYWRATFRSLHVSIKDLPELYIKKAHVNLIFRIMEYSMAVLNTLFGAILGAAVAHYYGLNYKYGAAAGAALLLWISSATITLILNDLNLAYKTLLYIHTIDDLYGKKGYTIHELQMPLSEKELNQLESLYEKKVEKKTQRLEKRMAKMSEKSAESENSGESGG